MKLSKGKRGVCAGGHPLTVEAGRKAFEAGGNAVDAAVAAQLMACVAEPLLTGLGGGGLALLKTTQSCQVLDFFSDRPGLGPTRPFAPLEKVAVSFGADLQEFSYGVASVAIPGMIPGLWELHKAGGVLPLPMMARWAADVADQGLEVSAGLSKSINALAPILEKDSYLKPKFFTTDADNNAQVVNAGHRYAFPELSETLMRWASGGPQELFSGDCLKTILETLGNFAPLGQADFDHYTPRWTQALSKAFKVGGQDFKLSTPALPSQGGVQILALIEDFSQRLEALRQTHNSPTPLDPFGAEVICMITEIMRVHEAQKGSTWPSPLLSQDLSNPLHTFWQSKLGFTTHISTYDAQGNAVGITSSLGETAGLSVEPLGLLLNNFMGEEDVAPPHCLPARGERLFTMCSPSLLEIDHPQQGLQGYMLGSGGSSRIRSIIAHGVMYLSQGLLGLGDDLQEAVQAPRIHCEDHKLRIETFQREAHTVEQVKEYFKQDDLEIIKFDDMNLFFGGLHLASGGVQGLGGAGDPRRSGSVAIV